jgi:putative transposase
VLVIQSDDEPLSYEQVHTTNPIGSTFATVRLRQRVTRGTGSLAAGIAMAFKLIDSAQHHWRAANSAHRVALASKR